ncbi:MAG: hypothetical protein WCK95_14875 [Alphaproteobacteria bacterium]|jgi:hypothetical protein
MTLHWTIDPTAKLVTATAEGGVTRAEFEAFLDAVGGAGAHGYRKLFDGAHGEPDMEPHDILALGVRMRATHAEGPIGALAAVVPGDMVDALNRVLGILAAAKRPMRVFHEIGPARKWIARFGAPTRGTGD